MDGVRRGSVGHVFGIDRVRLGLSLGSERSRANRNVVKVGSERYVLRLGL